MPFLPRAIGRWEILPNLRGKKTLQPGADGFIIEKKWEEARRWPDSAIR